MPKSILKRWDALFESFSIDDMGNDMGDVSMVSKQAVTKRSKLYASILNMIAPGHGKATDDDMYLIEYIHDNYNSLDDDCRGLVDRFGLLKLFGKIFIPWLKQGMRNYMYTFEVNDIDDEFIRHFVAQASGIHSKDHPLYASIPLIEVDQMTYLLGILPDDVNLNWLDVSGLDDMEALFCQQTQYSTGLNQTFNGDISLWEVGHVHHMSKMFMGCSFNGDISNWDVHNVQSMSHMFRDSLFNGDISNWKVDNVMDMYGMFQDSVFNGDISGWHVESVFSMGHMFAGSKFNGDLSKWFPYKVNDMSAMFRGSQFTGDLTNWDNLHARYANCSLMFDHCPIPLNHIPAFARNEMNEGFDVKDFGNDLDSRKHTKRHIGKHTRMYGRVQSFASLGYDPDVIRIGDMP